MAASVASGWNSVGLASTAAKSIGNVVWSGLAAGLRAGGQYPENVVHQRARRCSETGSSPS